MVPASPHLQNLSYSLDFVHTQICLRLGFQAGRVIFEVGSFCNIFVGIPELEKYSLVWMNMTLKAISHSFPEWNSALYCICLRAIWANIHYCWRDVHSLFLYCSSNHKLVVSISHLSLFLPGKHQIIDCDWLYSVFFPEDKEDFPLIKIIQFYLIQFFVVLANPLWIPSSDFNAVMCF